MPDRHAIRWALPARSDLLEAHGYLSLHNPAAAAQLAAKIREAVHHLERFPALGSRLTGIPVAGEVRSVVVSHFRMIYRVESDVIYILRVWDCRQDPDRLWDEID